MKRKRLFCPQGKDLEQTLVFGSNLYIKKIEL